MMTLHGKSISCLFLVGAALVSIALLPSCTSAVDSEWADAANNEGEDVNDDVALLQQSLDTIKHKGSGSTKAWPLLVPLNRESIPVKRNNVTVSYKTSYSGVMSVGAPAQEFRVVFDTGSAHVVLPSSECTNATCIEHRQYNAAHSSTSTLINVDGNQVPEDELCDQVTIGYGTGMITGEFVKEQVCPGNATGEACVEVNIVMAVDMTELPFRSFNFDGIFGLALGGLALTPDFSFFNKLAGSKAAATPQFGVFLTDGEDGQESEIALGGHNADRTLTPLQWAPVAMAKLGYWQVSIKEVRIGGKTLDVCKDGTCRGIVDTGTSHLGIPGDHLHEFMTKLSIDTDRPPTDCRDVVGEELEIVLQGDIKLGLNAENYMRPLALAAEPDEQNDVSRGPLDWLQSPQTETHTCAPRLMPVNLPDPLGPNLFILGEPVLHRYYTVYDWKEQKVGFGIAASNKNKKAMEEGKLGADETITSFMQVTVKLTMRACKKKVNKLPSLPAPSSI